MVYKENNTVHIEHNGVLKNAMGFIKKINWFINNTMKFKTNAVGSGKNTMRFIKKQWDVRKE